MPTATKNDRQNRNVAWEWLRGRWRECSNICAKVGCNCDGCLPHPCEQAVADRIEEQTRSTQELTRLVEKAGRLRGHRSNPSRRISYINGVWSRYEAWPRKKPQYHQ